MSQRIDYSKAAPAVFKAYQAFSQAVKASSLDKGLLHLVDLRASQINGCVFCVDMHVKEARLHGERELRLHHVAVWRESGLFSERERAAFEWTETLTRLDGRPVPDDAYAAARAQFSETELTELTFAIMAINGWNRIAIGFASVPGALDSVYGLDKAGLN